MTKNTSTSIRTCMIFASCGIVLNLCLSSNFEARRFRANFRGFRENIDTQSHLLIHLFRKTEQSHLCVHALCKIKLSHLCFHVHCKNMPSYPCILINIAVHMHFVQQHTGSKRTTTIGSDGNRTLLLEKTAFHRVCVNLFPVTGLYVSKKACLIHQPDWALVCMMQKIRDMFQRPDHTFDRRKLKFFYPQG